MKYFPQTEPPPRARIQKMIEYQQIHWEQRGYGLWALEQFTTGELIGRCGLQYLPDTDEVEVDFLLDRAAWGQGYATEAGLASLAFGFGKMDLADIIGIVHPENLASQRVLEKLGMKRTRRTRYFGMEVFRYAVERAAYDGLEEERGDDRPL